MVRFGLVTLGSADSNTMSFKKVMVEIVPLLARPIAVSRSPCVLTFVFCAFMANAEAINRTADRMKFRKLGFHG